MNTQPVSGIRSQVSETGFMARVYLWMALGLFISCASAIGLLVNPVLLRGVFAGQGWVLFGVFIALAFGSSWVQANLTRVSKATTVSFFAIYSMAFGAIFAAVFLRYSADSIIKTFAITSGTFLFFSVYGLTTKKDLTTVGSFAAFGFLGVFIASIVNIFLKSSVLDWIVTFVGIACMLGLIAWRTAEMKQLYAYTQEDAKLQEKAGIMGALFLYISFVNLFMFLLRIFGRSRD